MTLLHLFTALCLLALPAFAAPVGDAASPARSSTDGPARGSTDGPASNQVTIAVLPAAANVQVGDVISVTVRVEGVEDLYGADMRLQFDPSRFAVVDAQPNLPGIQVTPESELLSPDLVVRREADNQAGVIWYAVTQLNPRPPASGSGALFSFHLRAQHSGAGLLSFTDEQLTTRDAELISIAIQSGARLSATATGEMRSEYVFPLMLRQY